MRLIKAFILRQRTRPSEQEGFSMVLECQTSDPDLGLLNAIKGGGEVPMVTSSLTRDGDVDAMMPALIRSTGDHRFLSAPGKYIVKFFSAHSGPDKEATCIALVCERDASSSEATQSVRELIDRDREWEALGLLGNAMLTCRVGLDAHPNNIDLQFMLARLQTKVYPLVPLAVAALLKCREARPERADYAVALADAYEAVLSNNIPIKGATREQVGEMVVDLLTLAHRLAPDDAALAARLDSKAKGSSDDSFFT